MSFDCEFCNKSFTQKKNLDYHIENACSAIFPEKKDNMICQYCNNSFFNSSNCKRHMLSCKLNKDIISSNNSIQQSTGSLSGSVSDSNVNIITNNINIQQPPTPPPTTRIFQIYSIPTVNDKFTYTDDYVIQFIDRFNSMKHSHNTSIYDRFNFCDIFIQYLKDVYFNPKYPENFSFQFKNPKGQHLFIKHKDDWYLYGLNDGIDVFIEKSKLNFKCFMSFFVDHFLAQSFINSFNVTNKNGKIMNMFKAGIKIFFYDFGTLIQLRDKIKSDNNSEQAKFVYKSIVSFLKSKLFTMFHDMKKYRDMDFNKEPIDASDYYNFLDQDELDELEIIKLQLGFT